MIRTHDEFKQIDACHFVTIVTEKRKMIFLDDANCKIMQDQIFYYADLYHVDVFGYVIMPDHVHVLIWPRESVVPLVIGGVPRPRMPRTCIDFIRGIKSFSGKLILQQIYSMQTRGLGTPPITRVLWQSGYFDYMTTSKSTIAEKLEYIRQNPVKANLVKNAEDHKWLYINPNVDSMFESWKLKNPIS